MVLPSPIPTLTRVEKRGSWVDHTTHLGRALHTTGDTPQHPPVILLSVFGIKDQP